MRRGLADLAGELERQGGLALNGSSLDPGHTGLRSKEIIGEENS